jgi:hypothetical protein
MRPLSTRRSDEAGEADQATHAGAAPERENGAADGRDDTQVTNEIQAPAVAADQPTRVDAPQVAPPPDPLAAAAAGPGERGRLRRRLRTLKAVRAQQRAELGTLVFDARKRANGSRPEVVERRAAEAAEVERQVREIQHAVDAHADTRDLATGVAGSCAICGTLLSTEDRFCPSCGTPTKPGRKRPVDEVPAQPSADTGPQQPPLPVPTPARPLPATAPAAAPIPEAVTAAAAERASATTTESAALSADTTESPAVASPTPPPPADDAPLAHADPAAIPPPPPPATPPPANT